MLRSLRSFLGLGAAAAMAIVPAGAIPAAPTKPACVVPSQRATRSTKRRRMAMRTPLVILAQKRRRICNEYLSCPGDRSGRLHAAGRFEV
ncbi:hypothetical protein SH661x_001965 [Planctomicrobium sp. SH661]|uniref:hypothetical protein n=1 Tax=Planctomicrobium sp. SH661 TaxID=3448124 RepID=UPI003F5B8C54